MADENEQQTEPTVTEVTSAPVEASGESMPERVYPDVRPGAVVKIYQRIKEMTPKGEEKERIQMFEGTVLARRHGSEAGATITVRKMSDGIGVEKIFPLRLPTITKIEVKKQLRVRRAKLGFLRKTKKRVREVK